MYFGKRDVAIKRFQIEMCFDKFISETLEFGDYKLLDIFYDRFYDKLKNTVLPANFITYLMENTLREPVEMTDDFEDFMRQLILAGCRSDDQSPMYYVEIFFAMYYIYKKAIRQHDSFDFTFELNSRTFQIEITKPNVLKFTSEDISPYKIDDKS